MKPTRDRHSMLSYSTGSHWPVGHILHSTGVWTDLPVPGVPSRKFDSGTFFAAI